LNLPYRADSWLDAKVPFSNPRGALHASFFAAAFSLCKIKLPFFSVFVRGIQSKTRHVLAVILSLENVKKSRTMR
jgi:hypothetical protein